MNSNKGFTLIELVVVIVILGILAVTAVPRFVDLSDQANQAAVEGIAGAISSGMAVNYAGCAAVDFDNTDAACEAINNACDSTEAGAVLTDAGALGDYTFTAGSAADGAAGDSGTCNIALTADNTITTTYTSIDTDDTSP